ncbi:MAG: heme exporter protein CcmB [Archaeoglobi archaeon]|nr:heme exporter protein CcmB [Archaeoglobi archaeon]
MEKAMKRPYDLFLLAEIIKKDIKVEARSKASSNQMLIFAVTTAFLFSFSIDAERFFSQIILLIILFTSIAGGSTSFLREFDFETIEGLKASPLKASQIMTAKMLSNLILVLTITALIFPICFALFNLEGNFLLTFLVLVFAVIPISGSITLLAPLAAKSRGREMLLLAMLFPVIFPVLMPAMKSINLAYSGVFDLVGILFITSYSGIIWSLSILLSDHIL